MMGRGSDCAARWAKKSRYVQSYVGQVGASGGLAALRLDSDDIPSWKPWVFREPAFAKPTARQALGPPTVPGYALRSRRSRRSRSLSAFLVRVSVTNDR
jgi:hypothetical protein